MSGGGIALVALVMVVGLLGTFVPLLPGLALVWAAALVYGLVEGFDAVGITAMATITVIAVAGFVVAAVVPHRAAGAAGAARSSLWLGVVLAVIGVFVIPVVGLPLGGLAGIFVGERMRTGDNRVAWVATKATMRGFGAAALAQLGFGVTMVLTWVAWVVAA